MSFGKALYFPYIHFKDENWLKYSLLYWDTIKRIVPPSYQPTDSDSIKTLIDENLIENVNPKTGDKPYIVGAAEEFIPTMETLLHKRINLNHGADVSLGLEDNAPESVVHVQKMDEQVIELLETSDLATRHGDWFSMDGALAGYYMFCLAAYISEKQRAPLLSDSFEMETAGTFFQHSRTSKKLIEPQDEEISFRLAKLILPVPCPENLTDISMTKSFAYHKDGRTNKEFKDRYRWRAGIEGTNSHLKSDVGAGRLRVRGMASVRFAVVLKALGLNILRCARGRFMPVCTFVLYGFGTHISPVYSIQRNVRSFQYFSVKEQMLLG